MMGSASLRACAAALVFAGLLEGADAASKATSGSGAGGYVTTDGTRFLLDGRTFRVAGVNNHYLTFGSDEEVRRVLDDAVAMNANVVRTFIQPVIGSPDGRVPTIWNSKSEAEVSNLGTRGGYMLSFDPDKGAMVPNDGPNGLQRVDFVLAEAGKRGLKVIVALLDFWAYTGGAQQMSAWYGSTDKYTFFANDARTRRDYRAWIGHVLKRVNTLTGVAYVDDPTVFAWELMNEPDIHPAPLLREWISDMSAQIKSLAPRHLVSTGHANMASPMTELEVETVDFGTWHGYASYAKLTRPGFQKLIGEFCSVAARARKPVLLEEFGAPRSDPDQADAYRLWLSTLRTNPDCAGWVVWRLVSRQDHGRFPEDEHDKFDIRNDDGPTWRALRDEALAMQRSVEAAR
jgi:mannan endo-1,4-beta-mannosidase